MPNTSGIRIEGSDRIVAALELLVTDLDLFVTDALKKVSAPIVNAARGGVSNRTGALAAALGAAVRKGQNRPGKLPYAVIGAVRGRNTAVRKRLTAEGRTVEPANYAHLVEFGTAAGDRSYVNARGRPVNYTHPGSRAQAFLGPALQSVGPSALEVFKQALERLLAETKSARA